MRLVAYSHRGVEVKGVTGEVTWFTAMILFTISTALGISFQLSRLSHKVLGRPYFNILNLVSALQSRESANWLNLHTKSLLRMCVLPQSCGNLIKVNFIYYANAV